MGDHDRPALHVASREIARRRGEAAGAGHLGDEPAARAAVSDSDPGVRAAGLSALVRMGAAKRSDFTRAAADPDPAVRRRAGELASPLGRAAYRRLLTDPEAEVVEAACFAAGEVGDRAAVTQLVAVARHHDDPLCRESAVAALGAIGHPGGLGAILAALDDRPAVRRRAVVALAPFDGDEVRAALEAALDDRDWQVRQAAEDLLAPGR